MATRTEALAVASRVVCMFAILVVCVSCGGPNFDDVSLVKSTRILGIVADAPEVRPGESSVVRALVVDPADRPLTYEWTFCASPEQLGGGGFGSGQYGAQARPRGCTPGSPHTFSLSETGSVATIPVEVIRTAIADVAFLRACIGAELPEAALGALLATTGIAASVQVVVRADDTFLLQGYKRVLLSTRATVGTNPPPPRVVIDGVVWSARAPVGDANGFVCAREDGAPTQTLRRGADIEIVPDALEEPWLEEYTVLDPTGLRLLTRRERAYYSWFTTGGTFSNAITISPVRNVVWRTPSEPGPVTLWVNVRDGHGGEAPCRLAVTLE